MDIGIIIVFSRDSIFAEVAMFAQRTAGNSEGTASHSAVPSFVESSAA
jgi:hypothetical protein